MASLTAVLKQSPHLIRDSKLEFEEWLGQIERFREKIAPHLNRLTLTKIGDEQCLVDGSVPLSIRDAKTDISMIAGDMELDLDTQGIFFSEHGDNRRISAGNRTQPATHRKYIWGLTRFGRWVLAELVFQTRKTGKSRFDTYNTLVSIRISHAEPRAILVAKEMDALEMLDHLRGAIHRYRDRRKELHQEAKRLAEELDLQFEILALVPEE